MIHTDKIEKLVPLGYLYLVVLGILNETVFFYQLNINIIKYSSIMDILISPIATLVSNPIIFVVIISLFAFCYNSPSILHKHGHKKWIKKIFELKKNKDELSELELKNYYLFVSIKTLAVFLLSIYVGYGSAKGFYLSSRMKSNKLAYDYRLTYNTGESENVCLIESNSIYFFYVSKGEKFVKIAPVGGIKNIQLLRKTVSM